MVTGATGFVGGYLSPLLRSQNHVFYGTSYPGRPSRSERDISYLDLRSEKDVLKLVRKVRPDWLFHLAAVSGVRNSWQFREETLETNLMGTAHLLEALRRHAPEARTLLISSSEVYGIVEASGRALREDHPFHLVSPYAFTKLAGELLAGFYHQVEKLSLVIARPFPHTGPGQSEEFVCSDWARQIARIEKGRAAPIIKVGNLTVARDFTDVRDVVRAYLLLMERGRAGEVYNVCSGRAYPLQEILDCLLSMSSRKIKIEVEPKKLRKIDLPRLLGSNRKIKKDVGWKPEIPLEKTLADLLEYWRIVLTSH